MIATKTMISGNKLKIKFACKRIEADPGKKIEAASRESSCDPGHQASSSVANSNATSVAGGKKRGPSGVLEGLKEKRPKMDRSVKLQCSTILKTLITHKDGWPFKTPVDPVKLKIPDYLSVISHPMDLGTIKSKLEGNMYFSTEEFAADVRLTFSNAMLYNPPGNPFHQMAENLNKNFEMRWSSLGGKFNPGSSKIELGKLSSAQIKKVTYTRTDPCKIPPLVLTRRSIPSAEKVRVTAGASSGEAEHSKTAQNCTPKLTRNINRGTDCGSRPASGSMTSNQSSSMVGRKCNSCGHIRCQCTLRSDSSHLSLSDMSSERSMGKDHHLSNVHVSRLDCRTKTLSTSQMTKSDPESDGAVSTLDDENMCPSPQLTTPVTDADSGEGWRTSLFDVQLSPEKALRAAKLKSRFSGIIWKAQQEKLLDHGDRRDPMRMQQEKERLERRQREEKKRIEAELRAAEAATQMRAETELKLQREREREEARIAVEKVQRTVEIEPNMDILEELERLTGLSPTSPLLNYNSGSGVFGRAHLRSPLEQIGLFIKAEYSGDEDDESILNEEGEEGEIF